MMKVTLAELRRNGEVLRRYLEKRKMKTTTIQTYLFDRKEWTKPEAKAWLKKHRKVADVVAEGPHSGYWHARQIEPNLFDLRSFRTIELSVGRNLKAVVGHLHGTSTVGGRRR